MIYLIRTAHLVINEDNTFSARPVLKIKIGYSSDPTGESRFSMYKNNGPIMVLSIVADTEADENLEKSLHHHFCSHLVYGREWYEECEDIVQFFKDHNTGKDIWKYLRDNDPISLEITTEKYKKERDYRKTLKYKVEENFKNIVEKSDDEYREIATRFFKLVTFKDRLKLLCELPNETRIEFSKLLTFDPRYLRYVTNLTVEEMRTFGYQGHKVEELYNNKMLEDRMSNEVAKEILASFVIGTRYTVKHVKLRIQQIYDSLGINKVAKSTDLDNYFNTHRCAIPNKETGKEDRGVVIVSKVD